MYLLGKALGGGIVPVSAVVSSRDSTVPSSAATRRPVPSPSKPSPCCARGLWAGVDVPPRHGSGSAAALRLLERGVLVQDTHGTTIRLAPPPVIERSDLDWGLDRPAEVLTRSV